MQEYVVILSTECFSYPSNDYGYWTGKTYSVNREVIPICDIQISDNTKRFKSRERAESAAERVYNKCVHVMKWSVEEIQ